MSGRYVLRRLAQLVPSVLGIVLLGFVLLQLAPGDPILALAGTDGDAEYYARMRDRFGLDDPVLVQLGSYVRNALTGELGVSFTQGRPVTAVILERVPATLLLTGTALAVSTVLGIGLGVFAARHPHGLLDVATSTASLTFFAAPSFWLGQLALLGLAGGLGWFPVQGMSSARGVDGTIATVLDVVHHLALPALVLASQQVALLSRVTRTAMLEEARLPHVRTARAKGLTSRRVAYVHTLRRALLPATTLVGGRVGHLLAGTVVVEVVFGWPGLGRLLVTAIQSRDQPVILGMFLLVSFAVVVANLLTDLAYGLLDPRIRHDRA